MNSFLKWSFVVVVVMNSAYADDSETNAGAYTAVYQEPIVPPNPVTDFYHNITVGMPQDEIIKLENKYDLRGCEFCAEKNSWQWWGLDENLNPWTSYLALDVTDGKVRGISYYSQCFTSTNLSTFQSYPYWPIWKTVTVGGETKDELMKSFDGSGCRVSDWAKEIIDMPAFSCRRQKTALKLVYITPQDLGFTQAPNTTEFFNRAKELGLGLCPPEIGPRLRMDYTNQTEDNYLWVAMGTIADAKNRPRIFLLCCVKGTQWLVVDFANPGDRWALRCPFVFILKD